MVLDNSVTFPVAITPAMAHADAGDVAHAPGAVAGVVSKRLRLARVGDQVDAAGGHVAISGADLAASGL
jgi:hypothetical protein